MMTVSHHDLARKRVGAAAAVAGRFCLPAVLSASLVCALLMPSLEVRAADAAGGAGAGAEQSSPQQVPQPARNDPPPGDSASILNLSGIGAVPASVLEYRVRQPAGEVSVAPHLTLMAADGTGTRYLLQLMPADPQDPFAHPYDLGAASPQQTASGERSVLTVMKGEKEYTSTKGTVILRRVGIDGFAADIEAGAFMPTGGGGSDEPPALRGSATGAWTLTCFAVTPSPGDGRGGWGVDGGAVAWFIDESLQSPYCSRFRPLAPR